MLLFAILSIKLLPAVAVLTMAVLTNPKFEGDILRIRCTENGAWEADLTSLGVYTTDKQNPGYDPLLVVSYTYSRANSAFEQQWGTTIDQTRANVTTDLTPTSNSGNVDFTMVNLRCADSGEFLCQTITNQDPYTFRTPPQNITIQAFGQRPQIVEDIYTEVKRIGETGYLNCTVSRKQNYKVIWSQPSPGLHDAWISKDKTILAKNQVINGKLKYEVIQKYKGNDRITYTLVVNRLTVDDGGRYKCTVFMQGTDVSQWPVKYGNLTVQGLTPNSSPEPSGTENPDYPSAEPVTCRPTLASTESPVMDVEREKLAVLQEMLAVEKERLVVEKQRLAAERERLALDKGKCV